MNYPFLALLTFFSLLCVGCSAVPQKHIQPSSVSSSFVDGNEMFVITSALQSQDYRIRVRTPASYAANPSKQYPIVIKIDGQWDFGLLSGAYNCLYFDGQIPETIFVGIDWNVTDDKVQALRARDLLPTALAPIPNSGRAEGFVDSLVKEIIPELNKRYRGNNQEYLVGGSWGGLFVTYALLERPDIFDGALAIGGSYSAAEPALREQIVRVKAAKSLAGNRLYLGMGKLDPAATQGVNYFDALKAADIKGLQLKLDYLDGFGHSGMNIPGYAGGLQFLFARPQLALSKEKLQRLAGLYAPADAKGEQLRILASDGLQLIYQDETINLLAQTETRFYREGAFLNLTFDNDQLLVETFFGSNRYRRVNSDRK
jgi:predicted alpha/beta superfamily hydrolase